MSKLLTINDIAESVRPRVYLQSYKSQKPIEGVKIINLENLVDEEGDFSEVIRINKKTQEVELIPGFIIYQINRSRLFPGAVKAWHLHFRQDELWYVVSSDHLLVGLWDARENSSTKGQTMRLVMGGGKSQLLFIPRGVAHGSANLINQPVAMWYFTNQQFDPSDPDERRINWDALGKEFWKPVRD